MPHFLTFQTSPFRQNKACRSFSAFLMASSLLFGASSIAYAEEEEEKTGPEIEFSFLAVAQSASKAPYDDPDRKRRSDVNYRADLSVDMPMPALGSLENRLFAHVRAGQGEGLGFMPFATPVNSTAFGRDNFHADSPRAVIAQLWYQGSLSFDRGSEGQKSVLEFNVGKVDPFVFFDQNAVANDEGSQFLNSTFVLNALLDAGGDIGTDENGFTPALRFSYLHQQTDWNWRASLGVLGVQDGAHTHKALSSRLLIGQLETEVRPFGLTGHYRLIYWNNPKADGYDEETYRRTGIALSLDQEIMEGVTLFTRLSRHIRNEGAILDRAYSFGGEISGAKWGREHDTLGLAFGRHRIAKDYAKDDALTEGLARPRLNHESVAEIYYRFRLAKSFEISPDIQYVRNPGGNSQASSSTIYGLRLAVNF